MGQDEKKNDDEDPERTTAQQTAKKRKRQEVAIFGNYRNYYGYRVGQELEEDPRLKVLKKEWFEGKDCLDIGCNNGTITITIAKKFGCRSILGVDIDGDRIQDAHWNLRRTVKMSTGAVQPKPTKLEDSEGMNGVQHTVTEVQSEETRSGKDLSHVVTFEKGNFVKDWWAPKDKLYHTIICLSVAKWIHLNWGDDGLIILFAKIWKLLEPGGILILEPQPWKSYYKNRLVSEMAQTNYHNIKIYPEGFQEVLLDKIGFRMVENITSRLSGTKTGFDRPILAFWK